MPLCSPLESAILPEEVRLRGFPSVLVLHKSSLMPSAVNHHKLTPSLVCGWWRKKCYCSQNAEGALI